MNAVDEICTITAKGQTTIPRSIRRALGVDYGARIAFRVENGTVTVRAAPEPEAETWTDPALAPFLLLLADDIAARPDALVALPASLADRIAAATAGVHIDPEAAIEGDVAL